MSLDSEHFFFKQKTAYEITYGDWGSDVCSSDLGSVLLAARPGDFPSDRLAVHGRREARAVGPLAVRPSFRVRHSHFVHDVVEDLVAVDAGIVLPRLRRWLDPRRHARRGRGRAPGVLSPAPALSLCMRLFVGNVGAAGRKTGGGGGTTRDEKGGDEKEEKNDCSQRKDRRTAAPERKGHPRQEMARVLTQDTP